MEKRLMLGEEDDIDDDNNNVIASSTFTCAMSLDKLGVSSIPRRYVLPHSHRPNPNVQISTTIPLIDLSSLHHHQLRAQTISHIRDASQHIGLFQVINHGIPESVMEDAMEAAIEFFNLPNEEKMLWFSDDVHKPIRYGTSLNHAIDQVYCWRDFIKHYSHPLSDWIHLWPSNPPSYREKMGNYAKAIQVLQNQLMEVLFESLGLNPSYLEEEIKQGVQLLAVNCYPACPEPGLTLGIPPHSDFGSLTILLQSRRGLEFKDKSNNWVRVPFVEGALVVQLGDQMEVLSNGLCKSVIHRAIVNEKEKRLSIASLHSFPMDTKVGPAPNLVDEENPKSYSEFSFKEFLDFISNNDISKGRFVDTLKVPKP